MEAILATGNNLLINIDGIAICYDDFGKGIIPIIFIHGFPFDKSSWQPQIDFLKSTHRVIAYDIRGFGKSTTGKEKESIRLFADDLIKFMDALEINKAIVCGLSMGGYILLNAVFRYPARFQAIVLSDTQCIADTSEAKEKRFSNIAHIMSGGLDDFTNALILNIFCRDTLVTKKEVVEKIRNCILSTSPTSITRTLRALAQRTGMCASLNKISIPVLILCGNEDILTPPAQAEYLHSNIANSTIHTINKAGHLSNLEQPEEFNQYFADFITNQLK